MQHLNPEIIRQQITALRLDYPDIEEDEKLWADSLEGQTELGEIADKFIERDQMDKLYIQHLRERINALEIRIDKRRGWFRKLMDYANITKLERFAGTISTSWKKQRVEITGLVPDEYMRKAPDMNAIYKYLKTESSNWATLSLPEPNLTIRTK